MKHNDKNQLLAILGACAGAGLVWYCGGQIIVPATAGVALYGLFSQTSVRPRHFVMGIGLLGAHASWFVVAAVGGASGSAVALDLTLLALAMGWLWLFPSRAAAGTTIVLEGLSLIANVLALVGTAAGSLAHKALVVHCSLRIAAIIALVDGVRKLASELPASKDGATEGESRASTND